MSEVRASYTDFFSHSFDAKGRITVPAEWRGEHFETSLFIFPSREQCLRVHPASYLGDLQMEIAKLKSADPVRKSIEDLAMTAQSATFDAQGRIMVKEKLRERAGLKKDVMLIGRFDHFLIWDKATWESKSIAQIPYEDAIAAAGR